MVRFLFVTIPGWYDSFARAFGLRAKPAWIEAAKAGNLEVLQDLRKGGHPPSRHDRWGDTALTWAANNGHIDVVRWLLEEGADINARQGQGATAVILAADKGHADIVTLLIERGANLNLIDRRENAGPIVFAARGGHHGLVKQLEAAGARWK